MNVYDILIIGGGPAGMMAAIRAAELNSKLKIAILEKMPRCGRKILITGKGRCNLTNMKDWQEFSTKIHPKANSFRSAFYNFTNQQTIEFFEKIGLEIIIERGDRAYPKSMRAMDVVDTLVDYAQKLSIDIKTNCEVYNIVHNISDTNENFRIEANYKGSDLDILASSIIIATGGLSYPTTGSTGDGHDFAESLGHEVTRLLPSLTALTPRDYLNSLMGISLKNIGVSLYDSKDLLQKEFGDLDFTDGGIEGPIGFKISRRAVKAMDNGGKIKVVLDLKPAVESQILANRVETEIDNARGDLYNILRSFMPASLVNPFMIMNPDLSPSNLVFRLKNWEFPIETYVGYRRAVITMGGVDMSEIKHKNLSSKLIPNLFFAGEVLDLDADTGGYNLQIAFSTGALAGESAAKLDCCKRISV